MASLGNFSSRRKPADTSNYGTLQGVTVPSNRGRRSLGSSGTSQNNMIGQGGHALQLAALSPDEFQRAASGSDYTRSAANTYYKFRSGVNAARNQGVPDSQNPILTDPYTGALKLKKNLETTKSLFPSMEEIGAFAPVLGAAGLASGLMSGGFSGFAGGGLSDLFGGAGGGASGATGGGTGTLANPSYFDIFTGTNNSSRGSFIDELFSGTTPTGGGDSGGGILSGIGDFVGDIFGGGEGGGSESTGILSDLYGSFTSGGVGDLASGVVQYLNSQDLQDRLDRLASEESAYSEDIRQFREEYLPGVEEKLHRLSEDPMSVVNNEAYQGQMDELQRRTRRSLIAQGHNPAESGFGMRTLQDALREGTQDFINQERNFALNLRNSDISAYQPLQSTRTTPAFLSQQMTADNQQGSAILGGARGGLDLISSLLNNSGSIFN